MILSFVFLLSFKIISIILSEHEPARKIKVLFVLEYGVW